MRKDTPVDAPQRTLFSDLPLGLFVTDGQLYLKAVARVYCLSSEGYTTREFFASNIVKPVKAITVEV
jgi:hypothetical protein